MRRPFVLLSTCLLFVPACAMGNATERPDAAPRRDGGGALDTGVDAGADASASPDTGSTEDAGVADDAFTPGDDAFVPPDDAFVPADDAFVPPVDAGHDTGPLNLCAGVDCTPMRRGLCDHVACDATTGTCVRTTDPAGTACNDNDRCTTGDVCSGFTCAGTAVSCSAMTTACAMGSCNPATGACQATPINDGMSCGGSACAPSTCNAGACVAGAGIADCGACGTGMYCAAGACGANPTMLTQGFEGGALPAGWTNGYGGTTHWRLVATGAHSGTYRGQSGAIGNSASSAVAWRVTLASSATLSFWLTTSTEAAYDYLHFFVDGHEAGSWSGSTPWTQVSFGLGAGMHTLEWRYTKDAATVAGSDAVWIDDVTLTSPAPSASTDFEAAALPLHYVAGGVGPWVVNTTMPHAGTRAGASAAIGDSQTTSMFTTVAVSTATSVSYWYRASTEAGYDFLDVYIDGTRQEHVAGTVAWTQATHALAVGTHVVEWRYTKDGATTGGSDRVWVDDVVVGGAPTSGGLCP